MTTVETPAVVAPFLLLDYVPLHKAARHVALLAWFEPGAAATYGLGVTPGKPFDPRPFVARFPEDADQLWVFAEWAAAVDALVQEGASACDLAQWLSSASPVVLAVAGEGATDEPGKVLVVTQAKVSTEQAAMEIVAFLLGETVQGTVVREPFWHATMTQYRPDFAVVDDAGVPRVVVEVKKMATGESGQAESANPADALGKAGSGTSWQAAMYAVGGADLGKFDLNAPELREQLHQWLARQGMSRP